MTHALQFIIFTATSVVPCLIALYTCSRGISKHITQACLMATMLVAMVDMHGRQTGRLSMYD